MNLDIETQGMINQYYPQRWYDLTSCGTLQIIFDYLKTIKLTPYYKALLRFKWETGLLAFPMFDQKNMIETYLPWHHLQPLANTDFLKQLDVVKSGEM